MKYISGLDFHIGTGGSMPVSLRDRIALIASALCWAEPLALCESGVRAANASRLEVTKKVQERVQLSLALCLSLWGRDIDKISSAAELRLVLEDAARDAHVREAEPTYRRVHQLVMQAKELVELFSVDDMESLRCLVVACTPEQGVDAHPHEKEAAAYVAECLQSLVEHPTLLKVVRAG